MNFIKKTVPFALGILLVAGSAFSQGQQTQDTQADSVTDKELKKFVETTQELQGIQQEVQTEVQAMVKKEDMKYQRFQQIMMSKQNPQMAQHVKVTDKEEETIKKLEPKLQEISQEAQKKQMAILQEKGLSPQRFQQIAQVVQSDPKMMQRFQKMSAEISSDSDGRG